MKKPTKKESDVIINEAARSASVCLLHALRLVGKTGFVECDIEHNGEKYHLSFRHHSLMTKPETK